MTKNHWYEHDDFWEVAEPVLFSSERITNGDLEVEEIIRLLNLEKGSRILDLCCGIGRHSIAFARRGFDVTAVDRTGLYLSKARETARKKSLQIEFINKDMRYFFRPDHFDCIINLFSSFGYFDDENDDRRVLDNAYKSLRAGGVFLLDLMGKEILARIFRERDWRQEGDYLILEERELGDHWNQLNNKWIIIKDKQVCELHFSLRIYSAAELSLMLKNAGFSKQKIHGNYKGAPYNQDADRLVVAAWK